MSSVVSRLVAGDVGHHDRPRRHLTSHVPMEFQRHYSSSALAATDVGAGITDRYLRNFVHPALYHLLQILGVHHGEIERHLTLLQSLHNMVAGLQLDASAYGAENWLAIVNLRDVVQDLHSRLALVDSGSEIFTRRHVEEAMIHVTSTFESRMDQVSDAVRALIEEAVGRASAAWQASLEDGRLPRLEALVSDLQRSIPNPPPGACGPPGPAGPSGPWPWPSPGPPGPPSDAPGSTNPYSDCILALKRCVASICAYLGISASGVPDDASISLRELYRHISTLEADGQQDAAEIETLLETSARQAATIAALQTKVDQLELSSTAASSINLSALQDDLDALRRDLDRLRSGPPRPPPAESSPADRSVPSINVVSSASTAPPTGTFKPTFKEKYTPNEGSITSFLYVYESAMEEATNRQKVKHLPSCLSRIAQEIMVPHLMACNTWTTVKEALISEFGSAQTLSNQKQAFMSIQIRSGETAPAFAERFYREAQVLVTCGRLTLDDAVTAAVSAVAAHPHLQLYLKGVRRSLTSIREIKEAFLDIPPNLLSSTSSSRPPLAPRHPRVSTLNSEASPDAAPASGSNNNKYPCAYCGGRRHSVDKCFRKRAEDAEKALSA